jgi:hypothetical protein
MSAEALFGEDRDRAAFEEVAAERATVEKVTEDHATPIITATIVMYTMPLTAATYGFDC